MQQTLSAQALLLQIWCHREASCKFCSYFWRSFCSGFDVQHGGGNSRVKCSGADVPFAGQGRWLGMMAHWLQILVPQLSKLQMLKLLLVFLQWFLMCSTGGDSSGQCPGADVPFAGQGRWPGLMAHLLQILVPQRSKLQTLNLLLVPLLQWLLMCSTGGTPVGSALVQSTAWGSALGCSAVLVRRRLVRPVGIARQQVASVQSAVH